MMDEKLIEQVAEKAAEKAARKTVNFLKNTGRVRFYHTNSFKKTEEILYLYPNLPPDNKTRKRVDQALTKIQDYDYKDIIASKYFEGLTLEQISEIYDCKQQTISQRRTKLVKIIACELFPEDVLKEILER